MTHINEDYAKEEYVNLPIINTEDPGRKYTEKEENWLRELIVCEFTNIETNGLTIGFSYGTTRKSKNFKFFHGGKYRIPRFIAMHIDSRAEPRWEWRPDGTGSIQKERAGNKPRFQMREVFV